MLSHHPWCNWFYKPTDGCKMCERLYAQYPLEDQNGNPIENIAANYFPDAIKVTER